MSLYCPIGISGWFRLGFPRSLPGSKLEGAWKWRLSGARQIANTRRCSSDNVFKAPRKILLLFKGIILSQSNACRCSWVKLFSWTEFHTIASTLLPGPIWDWRKRIKIFYFMSYFMTHALLYNFHLKNTLKKREIPLVALESSWPAPQQREWSRKNGKSIELQSQERRFWFLSINIPRNLSLKLIWIQQHLLGHAFYHAVVDHDGKEDENQLIFFNEPETSLLAATTHFLMDGTFKPVKSLKYEQLFIISGA